MSIVLFVGSMAAMIGLWIKVCRLDGRISLAHAFALILMIAGAAVALAWSLGAAGISLVWVSNGFGSALFGLAVWLAFDRRRS